MSEYRCGNCKNEKLSFVGGPIDFASNFIDPNGSTWEKMGWCNECGCNTFFRLGDAPFSQFSMCIGHKQGEAFSKLRKSPPFIALKTDGSRGVNEVSLKFSTTEEATAFHDAIVVLARSSP